MFCCMDFGASSSDFPGNRRRTDYQTCSTHDKCETVSATVPFNKYGGEQITVSSPSGIYVNAVIPYALKPEDTFRVDIPRNGGIGSSNNDFGACTDLLLTTTNHDPFEEVQSIQCPSPSAPSMESVYNRESKFTGNQNDNVNMFDSLRHSTITKNSSIAESTKKLIIVKVPRGVAPGTMIQVKVPGEDRLINATVPPNVSEFYVDPHPKQTHAQNWQANSFSSTNGAAATGYVSSSHTNDMVGSPYNRNGSKENFIHNRNGYQKGDQYQAKKDKDDSSGVLAPMLVGSALLGAAGIMIGKHHSG